jgi:protein TonB
MLNVLLESKAQHTRRIGGTVASAVVHGAVITAAVLLTVQRPRTVAPPEGPVVIPVFPSPPAPPAPTVERRPAPREAPRSPIPSAPISIVDKLPTNIETASPSIAPIQPGPLTLGPALGPVGAAAGPAGLGGPEGGAIDAQYVEKPPQVLRSERPHFPEALRARGQGGRIVVQFVVDTLGRAEMSEFKVVDATDAQLADPVRAVLPRFRFTPGEAGGRKVRTMVALPFDFTLVR